MTSLIIGDEESFIIFQTADFPDYFVNKHHPDDFKVNKKPVRELIYNLRPSHNRLILRQSFKISDGIYIPFTFICDTGAPNYIYLNEITRRMIRELITYDDIGAEIIKINGKKMLLEPSPANHPDTNIIGLRALSFFGLYLEDDSFGFTKLPDFF